MGTRKGLSWYDSGGLTGGNGVRSLAPMPDAAHPADNVTALRGGSLLAPTPNEGCVRYLRDLLAKAESGEVVGLVCATLHGDGLSGHTIAGMIGPNTLLGAVEMAKADLMDRMRERLE